MEQGTHGINHYSRLAIFFEGSCNYFDGFVRSQHSCFNVRPVHWFSAELPNYPFSQHRHQRLTAQRQAAVRQNEEGYGVFYELPAYFEQLKRLSPWKHSSHGPQSLFDLLPILYLISIHVPSTWLGNLRSAAAIRASNYKDLSNWHYWVYILCRNSVYTVFGKHRCHSGAAMWGKLVCHGVDHPTNWSPFAMQTFTGSQYKDIERNERVTILQRVISELGNSRLPPMPRMSWSDWLLDGGVVERNDENNSEASQHKKQPGMFR